MAGGKTRLEDNVRVDHQAYPFTGLPHLSYAGFSPPSSDPRIGRGYVRYQFFHRRPTSRVNSFGFVS